MSQPFLTEIASAAFGGSYFGKLPTSAAGGALDLVDFANDELLGDILSTKAEGLDAWVVHGSGERLDLAPISPGDRWLEYQRRRRLGHSLLIRHSEKVHARTGELAARVREIFFEPVDIQIYETPPSESAFHWHYDAEEVFVVQTRGTKEFILRKNTINPCPLLSGLPKDMRFEDESSPLQFRVQLKPGDWLYIPSGYWHRAVAGAATASRHISIGVMASNGLDFLNFLQGVAAADLCWRRRLAPGHQGSDLLDLFARSVKDEGLMAKYRAFRQAQSTDRLPFFVDAAHQQML